MAAAGSCRQRDGHLANSRNFALRQRLAARDTIFKHKPNGVFGHGECLLLVLAVGDDLWKRRDAHSEPAFLLGLEHHRECPLATHYNILSAIRACIVAHEQTLSTKPKLSRVSRPLQLALQGGRAALEP